jgi:hypothetical protein
VTQFPTHVPLHEDPRFESRPGRLAALFRELKQIMQGWKNLPSISTAAQENAGNVTMSRRSGNEAGERSSNQLGDLSDEVSLLTYRRDFNSSCTEKSL